MARPWEKAIDVATGRVQALGGALKAIKASFERNEISAAECFKRLAAAVEKEQAKIDRIMTDNEPPLDGDHRQTRVWYQAERTHLRERITALCKNL